MQLQDKEAVFFQINKPRPWMVYRLETEDRLVTYFTDGNEPVKLEEIFSFWRQDDYPYSTLDWQKEFTNLINTFLTHKVSAEEFCKAYFAIWKAQRDRTYEISEMWSKRHDLELQEKLRSGEINSEEFSEKWAELWGYDGEEAFHEMKDQIFTACDVYTPHPKEVYELDAQGLHSEVSRIYQAFMRSQKVH